MPLLEDSNAYEKDEEEHADVAVKNWKGVNSKKEMFNTEVSLSIFNFYSSFTQIKKDFRTNRRYGIILLLLLLIPIPAVIHTLYYYERSLDKSASERLKSIFILKNQLNEMRWRVKNTAHIVY